jgi:hypothetical protein
MSTLEKKRATIRRIVRENLPNGPEKNPLIFGPGAAMDSLGLVNFLADLEFRLGEEFGREIVLASEQAMSRSRSPFRDVDALTEYILELLHS